MTAYENRVSVPGVPRQELAGHHRKIHAGRRPGIGSTVITAAAVHIRVIWRVRMFGTAPRSRAGGGRCGRSGARGEECADGGAQVGAGQHAGAVQYVGAVQLGEPLDRGLQQRL